MTATRTNPITAEVIRQAIDGIDAIVRAELYPNYSGRGMNGRTCVGVVVPDARDLLALGVSIACVIGSRAQVPEEEDAGFWWAGQEDTLCVIDDAIAPIRNARVDSLGTGLIVYWPGVTAEETQP